MKVDPRGHGLNFPIHAFQAIAFRVLRKLHGQVRATDTFQAGPVLDNIGIVHLASLNAFFKEDGIQGRPHGLNGGGQTARSTADYDQVVYLIVFHQFSF
jgi:hypothetical protein